MATGLTFLAIAIYAFLPTVTSGNITFNQKPNSLRVISK